MKRLPALSMVFAIVFSAPFSARAEEDMLATPNIVTACSESYSRSATSSDLGKAAVNSVLCSGVTKYVDPVEQMKSSFDQLKICIPRNATREQLARVFIKYADAHPEIWHLSSWEVTMYAFHDAFKCSP